MGIDVTLANECKTAAVGQLTPDWRMHTNRKLQLGGAPHPPGGDCPGLNPPRHSTGEPVTGTTKNVHRSENKQRQRKLQEEQDLENYWKTHGGNAELPQHRPPPGQHRNKICPYGRAVHHPSLTKLLEYATKGCPVKTGRNWEK